jgi:metallo-beta-lactamase family protein
MCEAGRILHHLKHNAGDARNTILVVGFMAEHTLGRRIRDGVDKLKIYGDVVKLRAEVQTMGGLSAHADCDELIDLLEALPEEGRRRIVLVHGEVNQAEALKSRREGIGSDVTIPEVGQKFTL